MQKKIGLVFGPVVFVLIFFFGSFDGLSNQCQAVLATTFWIAIWWITEAVPIAASALLPIVLFPLSG